MINQDDCSPCPLKLNQECKLTKYTNQKYQLNDY